MKSFIFITIIFLSSCGAPEMKMKTTNHFDGERFFFPPNPLKEKSLLDLVNWKLKAQKKQWPKWIEIEQSKIKSPSVTGDIAHVTFINHSTFLIQMNGINILTDPIYSERTSPVSFAGPKRVKKPGVAFYDLPKIDAVVISHNHYDHFDVDTLEKLAKRDAPKIFLGLGNSYYLKKEAKKLAVEMDWYDSEVVGDVKIHFLPARHWNKRGLFDFNKTLWGAYAFEGVKKVYFAGDTGYDYHFKDASKRFGAFDLSLIPIGAYEPRWFMKWAHVNPEEAVLAHKDLKSKKSIGMHFGTFQLTDEGYEEPALHLKQALKKIPIDGEFIVPENGLSFIID